MSSTIERDVISEALRIIDRSLGWMHTRELVSTAEVSDLLLDMRSVLAAPSPIVDDLEAVGVN
ncbi:MAG: hypothetical protein QOI56_870 [Actinomycetota bacterium]|jgi:hypothetical protein|nr:hypothetical protein [Actinomycetota bacterium]MEA2932085.1 hypothetical protein [Actinomycetota bacterium]